MVNNISSLFFAKDNPLFTLLNTQRNLVWGFLHLFPLGGKTVLRDSYTYFVHDQWNDKHKDRIEREKLAFEGARREDRKNDPQAYEDLKLRYEFRVEQDCLEEELRTQYRGITCGYVTLKDQFGNFTTRWLEVFLNSENKVGIKREKVAKKLLESTDLKLIDYNIFSEHAKSGGRSSLGKFAQDVAKTIDQKVSEILKENKIVCEKGSLSCYEDLLGKIDERLRNIIFINSICDLLTNLNALLQGNALVDLLQRLDAYKKPELFEEFISPGKEYAKIFSDLERQLKALNVAALEKEVQQKVDKIIAALPEEQQRNQRQDMDLLMMGARDGVTPSFLGLHKALKDICTLLKVHLVKDFTQEEIQRAMEEKAMQTASSPMKVDEGERKVIQKQSDKNKEKLGKSTGGMPLAQKPSDIKKEELQPRDRAFSVSVGSLQGLGSDSGSPRQLLPVSDRGRVVSPVSSPGRSGLNLRTSSAVSPTPSPRSPRASPRASPRGSPRTSDSGLPVYSPLSRRLNRSGNFQRVDQTGAYQALPTSPPSSPRDPSMQPSLYLRRGEMLAVLEITDRIFNNLLQRPQK